MSGICKSLRNRKKIKYTKDIPQDLRDVSDSLVDQSNQSEALSEVVLEESQLSRSDSLKKESG